MLTPLSSREVHNERAHQVTQALPANGRAVRSGSTKSTQLAVWHVLIIVASGCRCPRKFAQTENPNIWCVASSKPFMLSR